MKKIALLLLTVTSYGHGFNVNQLHPPLFNTEPPAPIAPQVPVMPNQNIAINNAIQGIESRLEDATLIITTDDAVLFSQNDEDAWSGMELFEIRQTQARVREIIQSDTYRTIAVQGLRYAMDIEAFLEIIKPLTHLENLHFSFYTPNEETINWFLEKLADCHGLRIYIHSTINNPNEAGSFVIP